MAHNLVLDVLLCLCINADRSVCCETLLEIQARMFFFLAYLLL